MSHELETEDGVTKMAYTGDVPWHGLGQKVDPEISVEEMMKVAGLDWEVKKTPIYNQYYDPKTQKSIRTKIPHKHALTRMTDGKVLTICGDNWRPTQNAEAFEFFREFCEVGGAKMSTAGSMKEGQHVWALAELGSGFTLPNGDRTEGYLLFRLPHVVGTTIQVMTTSVRVVCNNTMSYALAKGSKSEYRQNHMADFDFDKAKEVVEMANQNIAAQGEFAKKLMSVKMGRTDVAELFQKLLNPTIEEVENALEDEDVQAIIDSLETPAGRRSRMGQLMGAYVNAPGAQEGTAWGALNAVTYWADHMASNKLDKRVYDSWWGGNQRMKTRAQELLTDLAA